ncbi:hypothetical protein COHA_008641 [Chlorella ohadii]|uniref:Uncharacterized protein n=1 Tax=Chlorella ohadii TaxID=2649997 RepID=A0AAD5DGC0_9CHLO|nr:hypothetical protein COHA_008641 [Chlorella ohadii]
MDGTSCCLQPNGKFCARLERWADAGVPPSWRGGDNATTTIGSGGSGGGGGVAASESAGNRSSTVWGQSASMQEEQEKEDSGKPWRKATATYFNAYPACCTDDGADSTECDDFSGCEWAGQFAGVSGKKSRSWVRERNIVAFFEAGRSEVGGREEGGKASTVLDTCSDDDCDGCCTSNALKNGGYLIDLEAATAERFWEGDVHGLAAIQRQVV